MQTDKLQYKERKREILDVHLIKYSFTHKQPNKQTLKMGEREKEKGEEKRKKVGGRESEREKRG